nr:unnamed protein product [Digitaria exilis]
MARKAVKPAARPRRRNSSSERSLPCVRSALVLVVPSVSSGTTGSQATSLPPPSSGSAAWQLRRMAAHSSLVHVVRTHFMKMASPPT